MTRPTRPSLVWRKWHSLALLALACLAMFGLRAATSSRAAVPRQAYLPLLAGNGLTEYATWSAPIAVAPSDGAAWVVNPDAGSVTRVDEQLGASPPLAVGQEPWSLAFAPDGRTLYVVDRAAGTLVLVDTLRQSVRATLPLGPEPGGLVLDQSGLHAYVALTAADELLVVDTARLAITARIAVKGAPYALAFGASGAADARLYVTHVQGLLRPGGREATDDGKQGLVSVISPQTNTVATEIVLPPDSHGFPNMLASIAVAGGRAWVPHTRAAPALPNGLSTTTFAAVATLDRGANAEDTSARLLLNDELVFGSPVNTPLAVAPSPDGTTLYVVLAGSDLVEVIDIATPTAPRLVRFLPAGKNPRGIAISADGRRGYVMSYLSRAVTVLDLQGLAVIATVPVVGETLPADVLRGKQLFNSAGDPRMARGGWVACASCHLDGGADGVTWLFPDGPRQSPPLWNASQTLPWHWSAALDEPQDVEDTIQVIQLGLGLAPGNDPPLLGTPHAGRGSDLDALAAYMARGIRTPSPPLTSDVAAGRRLFLARGCATCHGGPTWTTSALAGPPGTLDADGNGMVDTVLRDVGTYTAADRRGASGFDVPALLGVGLSAPYLHDGSQPTLEVLLASGHPTPGGGAALTAEETARLAAFLRTIGPATPPLSP